MKHLFTLILLLSFFSCDKEKDTPQPLSARSEKEIFNAIVGTWYPGRLAHDANFKNIQEVPYHECNEKYHVNFRKDSVLVCTQECDGRTEKGLFRVQIGGNSADDTKVHIKFYSISVWLSPNISHGGGARLHHYTDSTLIFEGVSYRHNGKSIQGLYSEFKRVKE